MTMRSVLLATALLAATALPAVAQSFNLNRPDELTSWSVADLLAAAPTAPMHGFAVNCPFPGLYFLHGPEPQSDPRLAVMMAAAMPPDTGGDYSRPGERQSWKIRGSTVLALCWMNADANLKITRATVRYLITPTSGISTCYIQNTTLLCTP